MPHCLDGRQAAVGSPSFFVQLFHAGALLGTPCFYAHFFGRRLGHGRGLPRGGTALLNHHFLGDARIRGKGIDQFFWQRKSAGSEAYIMEPSMV